MKLNVMTFNVQHFRNFNYPQENRIEMDFFADYVRSKNPDIVGLNEVFNNGWDEKMHRQAFVLAEKLGYPNAYFAFGTKINGEADYGNAMVSRYPFVGQTVPVPDPDVSELNGEYAEPRCVLRADYEFDGKKLTVLCTHFGLNDAEARNAVSTVLEIAKTCPNPMILMGDFNMVPTSPILAPLYQAFEDTASLLDEEILTFPSNEPRIKIDYIFTKGEVKATSLTVNHDVVSDHFSMSVEIQL